jgi:hypothetical protein
MDDCLDSGTYHPHLEDCSICHSEWTEDNKPVGWYEDYICKSCDERIKTQQKLGPSKA